MAGDKFSQKALNILVAEDSSSDAFIISRGLTEFDQHCRVTTVDDGEALIQALGLGKLGQALTIPDLIIIDLYMPKLYGLQALQIIKREPQLADVPCVMISSFATETDRCEAIRLGAAGFLDKPQSLAEFRNSIRSIESIMRRDSLSCKECHVALDESGGKPFF